MHIEQFFLPGLGHQSYYVVDETSGTAAVIDPRRDVDVYLEAAGRDGAHITHILETHIHNDYVTGACELAARTEARIVAGAGAQLEYDHLALDDGASVPVGALTFVAVATPGHTPEHVSYILRAPGGEAPYAVFSGGSMMVGGAGRTDLLGPASTLALTRQQYHSLRRLLDELPGGVLVYPTHGAGSFCAAGPATGGTRHSTIAQERLASPAAQARDEEDFVRRLMAGYGSYPRYYDHMHDINRRGPRVLGALPVPPALEPATVRARMEAGTALVDGRRRDDFAAAHVPGALNVELDASFGTYVGWILPFDAPLLLVVGGEDGRREAVVQLLRIGYERVEGHLGGGLAAWHTAGLPTGSFERIGLEELHERWRGGAAPTVLDVRRDEEWREGHIPRSLHIHVADLPARVAEVPTDGPVAVVCATGYRAATAASILAASGRRVVAVQGGVPDWTGRGYPTVEGDDGAEPGGAAEHAHP